MITRYHTQSGSIYEVDRSAMMIRQVTRGEACKSGRVGAGLWRTYVSLEMSDKRLQIYWGSGRDEYSATADQFGTVTEAGREMPDASVSRYTHTSPIVKTEMVGEA